MLLEEVEVVLVVGLLGGGGGGLGRWLLEGGEEALQGEGGGLGRGGLDGLRGWVLYCLKWLVGDVRVAEGWEGPRVVQGETVHSFIYSGFARG